MRGPGTTALPVISGHGPISVSLLADGDGLMDAPLSAGLTLAEPASEPHLTDTPASFPASGPAEPEPVATQPELPIVSADPPKAVAAGNRTPDSPIRDDPAPPPPTPTRTAPKELQPAPTENRARATTPPPAPAARATDGTAASPETGAQDDSADSAVSASGKTLAPLASNTRASRVGARFDAAYLSNTPPPYPQASRRRGEEGQVILRVRVTADGRPREIQIAESSGHTRLDRAALDAVSRWRFEPARDGDRAVDSWVRVPVAFRLERT